jgi:hypothetical protein
MKSMFRKGFLQKSKKGSYIINVVRIGGQKIAIKHVPEIKLEKPTKPLVDVKKPEIKEGV